MDSDDFDPRPMAQTFRALAGMEPRFPLQLIESITYSLPVAVIHVAPLFLSSIQHRLRRPTFDISVERDRPLRGCLVAKGGSGHIFLDGSLPEPDARYTLAHELAHFLLHYQQPRARALSLLGPSIRAVLDGDRPPTFTEKLESVLRSVPLGVYTHALDRDEDGHPNARTARIEREADLLAFEILAPARLVLSMPVGDARIHALVSRYGLPAREAERWNCWVEARWGKDPFLVQLTGLLSDGNTTRVKKA